MNVWWVRMIRLEVLGRFDLEPYRNYTLAYGYRGDIRTFGISFHHNHDLQNVNWIVWNSQSLWIFDIVC